jgi:ribulose-5-phosphate 4-epimerase/fuculose-1-phosphate aldolase
MTKDRNRIIEDLIDAFRLFHYFRMDDLVYTHLSVRDPEDANSYVVNRRAVLFKDVALDALVRLGINDERVDPEVVLEAAHEIHAPLYRERPELRCVMHLHSPYGSVFSALEQKILMLHQFSLHFIGKRTAYLAYDGLVTHATKGQRLAHHMKEAQVAIMKNHGLLSVGTTVREAFARIYYLEQACRIQLEALKSGAPIVEIPEPLAESTAAELDGPNQLMSEREWDSITRLVR